MTTDRAALRAFGCEHLALTLLIALAAGGCAAPSGGTGSLSGAGAAGTGARASQRDARAELVALAARQVNKPDALAIAAPPPPGIPADLFTGPTGEAQARAALGLEEVLALFTDAADAAGAASATGPEQRIRDEDQLEATRAYVLGRSQRLAASFESAEASLRQAAKLSPRSAAIWRELGETYLARNNRAAAASSLRRAAELDPGDIRTLDVLSRLALERRDSKEAAALLARLYRMDMASFDPALPAAVSARLGRALSDLGYTTAGVQAMRTALTLPDVFTDPTNMQAELTQLYRQRGDLWRDAGDALLRQGDAAGAIEAYGKAGDLPTMSPASLPPRLVAAHLKLGRSADAALVVVDEAAARRGRLDEATLQLIRHVAANSSISGLLEPALAQVSSGLEPADAALAASVLTRARAAALADGPAAALLRERLAIAPADTAALRDLVSRLGATDAGSRLDETIRLIEAAPLNEARYARSMLEDVGGPEALLEALASRPGASSAAGVLLRARLLQEANRVEEADAALAELLVREPGFSPAIVGRVALLTRLGRYEEADVLLSGMAASTDPDLRLSKAMALVSLGRPEDALAELTPVLSNEAGGDEAGGDQAGGDQAGGDQAAGEKAGSDPQRVERLLVGARIALVMNDGPLAERWLREAMRIDPVRDEAFAGLVSLYVRGGALPSDDRLIEVLRAMREADPGNPTLRWLRAQEAAQRGALDVAMRELMELEQTSPERPGVCDALAGVWDALDREAEGEAWMRARLERRPSDAEAVGALATLLKAQKRTPEAISLLETELARTRDESLSRRLEAMLREDPAQRGKADELAKQRLARAPRTPETLAELAEIALAAGDYATVLQTTGQVLGPVVQQGRSLSAAVVQRLSRVTTGVAQAALAGKASAGEALELQRSLVRAAPSCAPEVYIAGIQLLVRTNAGLEALRDAAQQAGAAHESVRVLAYAAAVEALTQPATAESPVQARLDIAMGLLEHACMTLKPAPSQLHAFWVSLTLQSTRRGNAADLARALSVSRDVGNIDELLKELATIFPARNGGEFPPAEMAYQLAQLLNDREHQDLIEWQYRNAIRLKPDHIWANNNLGYRLLVDDRDIEDAHQMILRAYVAMLGNPAGAERASVTDSLGWARYKLGILHDEVNEAGEVVREGALTLLQRALVLARADPASADALSVLVDHVGDAYWAVGKTAEAVAYWTEAQSRAQAIIDRVKRQLTDESDDPLYNELRMVARGTTEKLAAVMAAQEPRISKIHREIAPPSPLRRGDAGGAAPAQGPQPLPLEVVPQPEPQPRPDPDAAGPGGMLR